MKKFFRLCVKALIISALLTMPLSAAVLASDSAGPVGPAPNSGDGIPDGPGFEDGKIPNGPNGEIDQN